MDHYKIENSVLNGGIFNRFIFILMNVLAASVFVCGLGQLGAEASVIRPDDRHRVNVLDPNWSAVGKLEVFFQNRPRDKWMGCTGTLVGRSIVLTAAHCVSPEEPTSIQFFPAYVNGSILRDPARILRIVRGNRQVSAPGSLDDWALLVIDKPLGDKYGFFPVADVPDNLLSHFQERVALVAYSLDIDLGEIAQIDAACSVSKRWMKELYAHDCDSEGNSSGGALIAGEASQRKIIGIHTGFDGWSANYGIPARAFLPELKLLEAQEKMRLYEVVNRSPGLDSLE